MSYDIITFGSASQDIHVKSEDFDVTKTDGKFSADNGFFLPFGSKIELNDLDFTTGGGGTNTAATFAKQGFRVAFCGAIGADVSGLEIVRELRSLNIDVKLIVKKKEKSTNSSIIVTNPGGDRIILVYRGASDAFGRENIPWKKIRKTKWIYLAPLANSLCDAFGELVSFAKENEIKVAVNPSKEQLSLPENDLKSILSKVDILFLNKEEASYLTKLPAEQELENIKKIYSDFCQGVVVITKGNKGASVYDGKHFYSAPVNENVKIVDTTGAGDSFAAGFLSAYIRESGNIATADGGNPQDAVEKAIQFGIANSEANIAIIGAKTGLLEKDAEFKPVKVTIIRQ